MCSWTETFITYSSVEAYNLGNKMNISPFDNENYLHTVLTFDKT